MHLSSLLYSVVPLLSLTAAAIRPNIIESYRLPKTVTPSHYVIDLTINPKNTTFYGSVAISIEAKDSTDTVRLHASQDYLSITNNTVLLDYKTTCKLTSTNNLTETVTFTCPKNSLKGKHTLVIEFEGTLSTDMSGIYKSTYEESGSKMVLVATQFETAYARRAFPCFDEPSFKASFDVFVTHPNDYTVLANTAEVQRLLVGSNMTKIQFQTTPRMSTYLVALVVSKFESTSLSAEEDYEYKVYARPSANEFMTVATTYGARLIDIMGNFTGIPYEKLGNAQAYQVAIPDFSSGAMENWGLITYREADLLDEGDKTSSSDKLNIITTIAHELSHQWFGDYVTLDWWSNTWLNEGFATYFEYHNPDLIEDLGTSNMFVIHVVQEALQSDAVPSSLPLTSSEESINTVAEDNKKFDDISYYKGGSIVRMIKGIVGENRFQKGLQTYLNKSQYSNTNPSNLLTALESTNTSSEYNITEIMETWIYKPGFPLITAKLDGSKVVLSQDRFTIVLNNSTIEKTQWYIPITYTTSDEKDFTVRVKTVLKPNSTADIAVNKSSWIILNVQQTGFYRVNYDNTLWNRIISALKDDKKRSDINVLNRAQLLDDIFNIARVGKVDYKKVFQLAEYLKSEKEYYPWASALTAISYISEKLDDDEAKKLLSNVTLTWINSAFANATSAVTDIDHIKESLIMNWACKLGQEKCIKYALQTFSNYKVNKSLPDYNLRGVVFCYALRNSSFPSNDYQFLFKVFKNSTSSIEQNVILSSLGCVSDSSLLSAYLSETIATNSSIRKQDAAAVFKAVYTHSDIGVTVALKFLQNNLKKIANTYKGMNALSSIVTGLAEKLTTHDQIESFKKIINDHRDIEDILVVSQEAIDITTASKTWTDTYGPEIKSTLKALDHNASNIPKPNCIFLLVLGLVFFQLFSSK